MNVHFRLLFREFNFRGLLVNRYNRENWIHRKFPAIQYCINNEDLPDCSTLLSRRQLSYLLYSPSFAKLGTYRERLVNMTTIKTRSLPML